MKSKKKLPLLFGTLAAGVVCLTMGIGAVFGDGYSATNPTATPDKLLVDEVKTDGSGNKYSEATLTYGQWGELKASGLQFTDGYDTTIPTSSDDPAYLIYQTIADDILNRTFAVKKVTVNCYVDNNQVSTSELWVAGGSTISIDANNVIKIGPTNLTACTNEGYEFVGLFNGSTQITSGNEITVNADTSIDLKWEKAVPPTIMTINNTSGSAISTSMNIFKEDDTPTKIIVGNSAPIISVTPGTQDIPVTLPTDESTIKISGGEWYFDRECLGYYTNDKYLTSITFGDNYGALIGLNAFYVCSGLTSITIPSSVTSIGVQAFYGCSGLTSITIPSSVTSIEDSAFNGCKGLTSITIPSSVTSIGSGVFQDCTGLTSISVASGNTFYDSRGNCNAIIEKSSNALIAGCKNTVIPDTVTSIGSKVFQNCTGLTSITIPSSVTSIGEWAFSGCSGLTSITIPSSVTSIESYAFYFCKGLTSITIPSSVTSIGSTAFSNCTGLTSITISQGVKSIGNSAFSACSGLTSITIPSSVTSIGKSAFYTCSSLTSVTFKTTTGWKADSTSISSSDLANKTTAATYLKSTYRNSTWTRS